MTLLDKVKISRNWMVPIPPTVREELRAEQGGFLNFIKKGKEVTITCTPLSAEKEAFE